MPCTASCLSPAGYISVTKQEARPDSALFRRCLPAKSLRRLPAQKSCHSPVGRAGSQTTSSASPSARHQGAGVPGKRVILAGDVTAAEECVLCLGAAAAASERKRQRERKRERKTVHSAAVGLDLRSSWGKIMTVRLEYIRVYGPEYHCMVRIGCTETPCMFSLQRYPLSLVYVGVIFLNLSHSLSLSLALSLPPSLPLSFFFLSLFLRVSI